MTTSVHSRPRTVALIVAAGRGARVGGDVPKQYRMAAGAPILRHTVQAFLRHPAVAGVRVVIHPDDHDRYAGASFGLDLLPPVHGGATRQQSVLRGLESLEAEAPDFVLIHDAARPLVDPGLIDRVLAALSSPGCAGAIAALPMADTLKRADAAGRIGGTLGRDGLWRAQTPQGFRFEEILAAHRRAGTEGRADFTDDAAVAEAAGLAVALVQGSEDNFKITTEQDLARAAASLRGDTETRTGTGFDVHAFEPGDAVMLCGVRVPFDRKLKGHSDADVAIHAAVDAILGAVGAGDIGAHFPPSDPRWRAAPSALFLARAAEILAERGAALVNLDLTIICEAPRIGPHRDAMIARLADILAVKPSRIAVKATTTEGLGFTGRGEGIAAHAVATVKAPATGGE